MEIEKSTAQNGMVYLYTGSKETKQAMVFVHGWSCRASDYTNLMQAMVESDASRWYIAPYLPGHGEPQTTETPISVMPQPSMAAITGLILGMMAELEIRDVILVGHSMGTRIVLQLWNAMQDLWLQIPSSSRSVTSQPKILGLVLLDGSHHRLRASQVFIPNENPKSFSSPLDVISQMFSPQTPAAFKASTVAHVTSRNVAYMNVFRQAYMDWDLSSLDATVAELGKQSTIEVLVLQSTDVDARNVRRRLNASEKTAYTQFLESNIKTAQTLVLSDCGHWPHVDQGKAVAKAVSSFAEQL